MECSLLDFLVGGRSPRRDAIPSGPAAREPAQEIRME